MENQQKIEAFFQSSPTAVSAGQVAEATGVDRKEVDKVMAKLKKSGQIESPKVCYWQWKKG